MMELLHAATTAAAAMAKDANDAAPHEDASPTHEDASPTHVEAVFEVTPPPRAVTFTTATTYVFNVAYGGSALPKESGPPIGMASVHMDKFHEDLREEEELALTWTAPRQRRRRRVRKFDHLERIDMLKRAKYHVQDIATFCMDAIDIRKSRQESLDQLDRDDDDDGDDGDDAHSHHHDNEEQDEEEDFTVHATQELKRFRPRMFEPAKSGLRA